ncbi:MAG: PAC2 family protein [Bifidobacterium sp.]|jgi:predicted ATP-grasp superfamily ATP-dependent carboligase|nr:PAC2 family protein [Bifidobacterium sp.]
MSEEAKTRKTAMICAFEGWNDACQAATNVIRHLLARYDANEIRYIRCDGYYDYQSVRPMRCTVTGRRKILWPQTTFYDIRIADDMHVFAQIAPEPNYRWIEYSRQSLRIAEEFDVEHVVTLGSMFADCPHTRPLPLDESDESCCCDMDREYNGPVGIPTVLDSIACEDGFDTTSLWMSIPQYLGSDDCAQATLQMLERLSTVLGVKLDPGDLPQKAQAWKAQASVLMRCNDELAEYVRGLERKYDMELNARSLAALGTPQAEQLVKETEEYLSHMGE